MATDAPRPHIGCIVGRWSVGASDRETRVLPLTLLGASIMDLNDLLHRHQVALMRAASAATNEARESHDGTARCYETKIETVRSILGASGRMVAA